MKKPKSPIKIIAIVIFSFAVIFAVIIGLLVIFVYKGINFEADERLFEGAKSFNSTAFYANCGGEGEDYQPVAIEISGGMRKIYYSSDEICDYLKKGIIAVEDKKFYEHKGIDIKRTLMAAANYVTRKDKIFGASTITQQVVKNISGDNQLKLKRKLGEIIRALHIEKSYTKEEILEVYLNVIPMSESIYGVGAASRAYFGKELAELLPEEAATLIGITNAPSAYNPYKNPDACKRKRDIILSVMYEDGVISLEEYTKARSSPLKVIPREEREDRFDSWFVETVIEEVTDDLADKYSLSKSAARIMLTNGGYRVYTTMNTKVQSTLEGYFENADKFPTEIKSGLNYAMVVTDSASGNLVGIVGRVGKKEGNRLLNHALVPHVPGSTLKPIALYAPLIDDGKINWATVFDDVPVSFVESDDGYREYPKNSPAIYDGLTTVKDALRNSKNTVAVRLCDLLTPKKIFNSLRDDFGFDTLIERENNLTDIASAPMALGQLGRGVPLLKLTESYSVFPGEGIWREASSYLLVTDHENKTILKKEQESKRIFKSSTAEIMNQLLMTVTNDGTAGKITLKNKVNTAGKTGTSGGSKDKSFIGYTPYFTAGIWCGYDSSDRAVTSLSKSHLEIWDEIMNILHSDIDIDNAKSFSTDRLIRLSYCMDSGKNYSESCVFDPRGSRRDYGYFSEDNAPAGECDRHVLCKYDAETKAIACDKCPRKNILTVSLISVQNRAFPKEITVTDAEYVYRDISGYTTRPVDYALPYFYPTIPEGVFVGRSKNKKQFNSNCYLHDE